MQTSEDAKRAMDAIVTRAGATANGRELRSHLHEAASAHAARMGRERVETVDVDAALADAGGERALANTFARAPPATLRQRAGAHLIDVAAVYGALLAVWVAAWLAEVGLMALGGPDLGLPRPDPFQWIDVDDVGWAGVPAESFARGLALGAFLLGAPFVYFLASDLRGGRTLGKRALGLRAVRVRPAAALLRAALKSTPLLAPLLVLGARLAVVVDEREILAAA